MAERKTKRENGIDFPAEAYAYVPDPEKPSTWKVRLWENLEEKETARQVGMALAALSPGGFRGNRVEIPAEDLPKVKARIRAAWKKVHPDADPEDMPPVLREGAEAKVENMRLLEYASNRGRRLNVERERGIIRDVKVLGIESTNGRTYSVEALGEAVKLYEGRPVNIDHCEGKLRSYRDRVGKLINVELRGDGLYGDVLVNPRHPLAEQLFWDAEHSPENVGLSHDAQGRTRVAGGRVIVESIERVRSVDLVAEPATTRSLYESVEVEAEPELSGDAEPEEDIGDVDKLPDEAFALVLPGGVKAGNRTHPLHKRYFPIHTPQAVIRSLERIEANRVLSASHKEQARARAIEAARRFGLDVSRYLVTRKEMHMGLEELTLEQLKEARPDLLAELQQTWEAELGKLREERDRLAAQLAAREELQRAGIAIDRVPASLLQSLFEAQEDRRKSMIEDLRKLVHSTKVESTRPGGGLPDSFESRIAMWR